jgi:Zn-dependent peptidase ImmA (M78 family)/DNA-binding XRE family transcriptional regulator
MAATVSVKAPINGEILRWARESIGVAQGKAAKRANVAIDIYKKWESGEDVPSMPRLRKLANLFKRPLPVFFLPHLPKSPPLPKDFRKPAAVIKQPLGEASLMAVRKARWYQTVAKELMDDLGQAVRSFKIPNLKRVPLANIINDIRKLDIDRQMSWGNNWEALKKWRNYLEEQGIFVFQFSMPVEEIRGFSLVLEEHPPVIVISSQDSPNGRIFTLFHEYSHILLEESGLCIPSEVIDKGQHEVEKFCNEFAGNFLVPTHHLKESIKESQFSKIQELIPDLSKKFIVSQFVILRRLYSEKEVDYKEYQRLFKELQKGVKKVEPAGGNFYKNQYAEKGKRFISLVVEAESSRKITLSRALDYLGIKTRHYDQIVDMLYE